CVVVVVHPAHLDAPQAQLDVRLAYLDLPQVQDAIRQEVLPPLGEPRRAERLLGDQEGREAELLDRGEEVEHFSPRRLDFGERVQRLEAVEREDAVAARTHGLLDDLEEDREPVFRGLRALQPATELAHVQDVYVGLVEVLHPHPHGAGLQAVHVLFQAHVEGLDAVQACVLVHHPQDEGGLHRPRRAGDEDRAASRDAAAEGAVETIDIRLEKGDLDVHRRPHDEVFVIKRWRPRYRGRYSPVKSIRQNPGFRKECFSSRPPLRHREGMAKRDDAALKLLRWELDGHGKVVMEAMLRHPDKSLAEAVDLIEQEVPSLSASDPSANDTPGEMPAPVAPSRPRSPPELDALSQEFQTFRHLLHPREAKEVEATLKELVRSQDRAAMSALRRRLRALSLQAAVWSELAAG